ncbi:MAG: tRNA pseudouridine(38-40) synthase TruA [Clostridia bacterium]|nr:tRNA pseudouridine(38-40) synthase TruA [Clostridia bacterium]
MRIKGNLAFDGTLYHGWQVQNNGITVQQKVEEALSKITGEDISVVGCSRTDAGVHAINYCVSFDSNTSVPLSNLPLAVNTFLPPDIRFYSFEKAPDDFNARYSAKSKTYIYKTVCDRVLSPFLNNHAYHFPHKINIDDIKTAAQYFLGTHDFSAFMATGGSQKTTVRTVNSLEVYEADGTLNFEINANAYLYNMVRIISGTLLYVGCGKIKANDIPHIIESTDRTKAGITAPPEGLHLKEIFYE